MTKMDKNILLISHNALSFCNNNGKTLASLFSEWDPSCLAQIFFNRERPDSNRFKKFFCFNDLDIILCNLKFQWRRGCGFSVLPGVEQVKYGPDSISVGSKIANLVKKFADAKLLLRDLVYFLGSFCVNRMYVWISDFKPDSVFFVGGNSVFSFTMARKISRSFHIPLDIYITDDYVVSAARARGFGGFLDRRLRRVYEDSFKEARHVFVIGDEMAESFSQVFGRSFVPVMNSVPIEEGSVRDGFDLQTSGLVDFVYAGGMHLGRDESILEFGHILKVVSKNLGLKATLTVYSLQQPGEALLDKFDEAGVVFGGGLGADQVGERMRKADFVLHVESFDPKYVRLTKLSVSTKIPEYLASGACVVAFGPSDLASIRLLQRNALGVVLTEEDSEDEMLEKLVSVIDSVAQREQLALSGYSYAKAHFDADVVRCKIKSLLNQ